MKVLKVAVFFFSLINISCTAGSGKALPVWESEYIKYLPDAPDLPVASGPSVTVSSETELIAAVNEARDGITILIEDGTYHMKHVLRLKADNVTLMGKSKDPRKVVLCGKKHKRTEMIWFEGGSGCTVAYLSVANIGCNGITIKGESYPSDCRIYNCILHNIWQRGVKGTADNTDMTDGKKINGCRIEYCLFFNDHKKEWGNDPYETEEKNSFNGNYIASMDLMRMKNLVISDNFFVNIHGRTYEGRAAIFLWYLSEDCVIERNRIMDVDSGIWIGNSYRGKLNDGQNHIASAVVKNNFIHNFRERGIEVGNSTRIKVLHNTISDPSLQKERSINVLSGTSDITIGNNLISGTAVKNNSGVSVKSVGNLEGDFREIFRDASSCDLRLNKADNRIVNSGVPIDDVTLDIDLDKRSAAPDIGADEFKAVEL